MSGGREWTTTEARRLHEMREQRMKAEEIGKILGRSKNSIYSFLRYDPASPGKPAGTKPVHRLPPKIREKKQRADYWSLDDMKSLRALAEEGASARQAAEELGRSYSSVRTAASRLGIRFFGGRYTANPEQRERHRRKEAEKGSAMLRDAMLKLLEPEALAA